MRNDARHRFRRYEKFLSKQHGRFRDFMSKLRDVLFLATTRDVEFLVNTEVAASRKEEKSRRSSTARPRTAEWRNFRSLVSSCCVEARHSAASGSAPRVQARRRKDFAIEFSSWMRTTPMSPRMSPRSAARSCSTPSRTQASVSVRPGPRRTRAPRDRPRRSRGSSAAAGCRAKTTSPTRHASSPSSPSPAAPPAVPPPWPRSAAAPWR